MYSVYSEIVYVLLISILLDRLFGEPRSQLHSTVWMGKTIEFFAKRKIDNVFYGAFIFLFVTFTFSATAYLLMNHVENTLFAILLGAIILKLQFSWRAMSEHAMQIVRLLKIGEVKGARERLSLIVGRDTTGLDEKYVVSAAVESIGESTVDGIISPLFYYLFLGGIFGLPLGISAAVFSRATNTLDSMIGHYRDGFRNMGFLSARMDDILNFIPARIGAILFMISSLLLKEDWKKGIAVFLRDRRKTQSPNSGQVISMVAGALNVRLEKIGFYDIGDSIKELNTAHIHRTLELMDTSTIVFLSASIACVYGINAMI